MEYNAGDRRFAAPVIISMAPGSTLVFLPPLSH